MKILLVVDDYLPHSIKVAAKMMHELAVELKHTGHEPVVLTPSDRNMQDSIDDIPVLYFKSGQIKNTGKIKRAVNETLLSRRAWKSCGAYFKDSRFDLIIYYSPSIFFGPLVKKLKKLWNCPSYLILRDFFPQWAVDNGIISENSPITRYFRYFEKINYDAADRIGIQSPNNLRWFADTYSLNKPLDLLYNWASAEKPDYENSKWRRKLGIENKLIFFYGGNIGHAQDMENLMRLAHSLRDEKSVYFVFAGSGDETGLVENFIKEKNLQNAVLLPPVSQDEFKEMLAEFDIGLFSLHKDHSTHNFPGKILGYMVNEMPILGSVNKGNDLKETVENAGAGFITINPDDKALLQNALRLIRDKDLREKTGENAGKLLNDRFSVDSAAETILMQFQK